MKTIMSSKSCPELPVGSLYAQLRNCRREPSQNAMANDTDFLAYISSNSPAAGLKACQAQSRKLLALTHSLSQITADKPKYFN